MAFSIKSVYSTNFFDTIFQKENLNYKKKNLCFRSVPIPNKIYSDAETLIQFLNSFIKRTLLCISF